MTDLGISAIILAFCSKPQLSNFGITVRQENCSEAVLSGDIVTPRDEVHSSQLTTALFTGTGGKKPGESSRANTARQKPR
jgi:hypothetical protein